MASPISEVDRFVPGVRAVMSASTAFSTRAASSRSPTCSSSSATDRIVAVGSAMPWPAMSGAEPCTGSNIDGNAPAGLMLPLAARPMPPVTAAARSVRMSPNRLSVTITSKRAGSVARKIVAASTCR